MGEWAWADDLEEDFLATGKRKNQIERTAKVGREKGSARAGCCTNEQSQGGCEASSIVPVPELELDPIALT